MDKIEATKKILNKLGFSPDFIFKKKRGNVPELTAYDFILAILENETGRNTAEYLNISPQTFTRTVSSNLTPIIGRLNGGGETFVFKLMSIIEHRWCSGCKEYLTFDSYHKDKSNPTGLATNCKKCRVEIGKNYYQSELGKQRHQESYDRNAGAIAARHSVAKLERSKREVAWSETKEIAEFFANKPSEDYHVDHELPLLGEKVSGLHVLGNLQYLTKLDNLTKGNKIDLDAYNEKYKHGYNQATNKA